MDQVPVIPRGLDSLVGPLLTQRAGIQIKITVIKACANSTESP
jgi:hypothetical protein